MTKTISTKYYNFDKRKKILIKDLWWINEAYDWGNIGVSVINRPTENTAFNNMHLQAKAIRETGFRFSDVLLTKTERRIYDLDILVNKEDFDYQKYNVFKKDTNIRKISKITHYSEPFVMKKLGVISKKVYLQDLLGVEQID